MPRPREFNQNDVLDSALQVFWRRGYDGTTIRDLVSATGLQSGSLYGAFDSKRGLFQYSLARYENRIDHHIELLLSSELSPLNAIRGFFEKLVSECNQDHDRKGCLVINTLLQVPASDVEISKQVIGIISKLEKAFLSLLNEAKHAGELNETSDPEAIASLLLAGIFGLRVYNKMQPDLLKLQQVISTLLKVLD